MTAFALLFMLMAFVVFMMGPPVEIMYYDRFPIVSAALFFLFALAATTCFALAG